MIHARVEGISARLRDRAEVSLGRREASRLIADVSALRRPGAHEGTRGVVELGSRPHGAVGRKPIPEAIVRVTREDVQMHVEDVLSGSFPVGEVEVDSFASQLRRPERGRGKLTHSEKLGSVFNVQIGEGCGVTTRHDDHVPAHRRLNVHERDRSLVLMDDADFGLAGR